MGRDALRSGEVERSGRNGRNENVRSQYTIISIGNLSSLITHQSSLIVITHHLQSPPLTSPTRTHLAPPQSSLISHQPSVITHQPSPPITTTHLPHKNASLATTASIVVSNNPSARSSCPFASRYIVQYRVARPATSITPAYGQGPDAAFPV